MNLSHTSTDQAECRERLSQRALSQRARRAGVARASLHTKAICGSLNLQVGPCTGTTDIFILALQNAKRKVATVFFPQGKCATCLVAHAS
jgi:hypothetical protein